MDHLLAKPHQNYNETREQPSSEPSEIKLTRSSKTMELKKPHQSKLVGDMEWAGRVHTHICWIKIWRTILGARVPSPTIDPPVQSSSAR